MDERCGPPKRSLANAAIAVDEDVLAIRIEGAVDLSELGFASAQILRARNGPAWSEVTAKDFPELVLRYALDRHATPTEATHLG